MGSVLCIRVQTGEMNKRCGVCSLPPARVGRGDTDWGVRGARNPVDPCVSPRVIFVLGEPYIEGNDYDFNNRLIRRVGV